MRGLLPAVLVAQLEPAVPTKPILIPLDSLLRRRILVSLYGLEYIFALDYIVPPKMFLHHLSKSVIGIDLNSDSVGTDWN